jgi:hypothetical protein
MGLADGHKAWPLSPLWSVIAALPKEASGRRTKNDSMKWRKGCSCTQRIALPLSRRAIQHRHGQIDRGDTGETANCIDRDFF